MEVGKLYRCEKDYLMFYPDQETAADAGVALTDGADVNVYLRRAGWPCIGARHDARLAAATAAYWSKRLGKPVSYTEKNIPLLPLNNKEEYIEVLAGDRKGWIIYRDWLEIKEIV